MSLQVTYNVLWFEFISHFCTWSVQYSTSTFIEWSSTKFTTVTTCNALVLLVNNKHASIFTWLFTRHSTARLLCTCWNASCNASWSSFFCFIPNIFKLSTITSWLIINSWGILCPLRESSVFLLQSILILLERDSLLDFCFTLLVLYLYSSNVPFETGLKGTARAQRVHSRPANNNACFSWIEFTRS